MIGGLILAAGASTRMGRPKAALPLGDTGETVLSLGVRTMLAAGVPSVTVVAGAHADSTRAALTLSDPRVRIVEHTGWRLGQLSSLVAGLDAIDEGRIEAVLVTLVDVPLVQAQTLRTIISAWRASGAPIVRPASGERHGHPVLFDRSVFGDLRAADPSIGAKAVIALHRSSILDVTVDDTGAFQDLDTPEDYQRVLQMFGAG